MNISLAWGDFNFQTLDQFRSRFEYRAFVQAMDLHPDDFFFMLRGFNRNQWHRSAAMDKLFMIRTYGANQSFPRHFRGVSWEEDGKVSKEGLAGYLEDLLNKENAWLNKQRLPLMNGVATSILSSVMAVVREVSHDFRELLPPRAVYETEMLLLLHICAGKPVDDDAAVCYRERVVPMLFEGILQEAMINGGQVDIPTVETREDIHLPLYRSGEGTLKLMQLTNRKDKSVRIFVDDTTLTRTLHPGKSMDLVMKAGSVAGLLPGFTVETPMSGDVVFETCRDGLAMHMAGDDRSKGTLQAASPIMSWALMGPQNWLLSDAEGRMMTGCCDPDLPMPRTPVVSVHAAGQRYCMLTADGRVFAPACACDWKDLIGVSYDGSRLMAIGSDRMLMSSDGSLFRDVVAVCQHEGHWLAMNSHGSVRADVGLPFLFGACAIAVGALGYAVANMDGIVLCDTTGTLQFACETDAPVEEMAFCGERLFVRDPHTGKIVMIGLGQADQVPQWCEVMKRQADPEGGEGV